MSEQKNEIDEQEKKEKQKSYKERVVRWQQLTNGQLSLTNNLFVGLNLGFLGFLATQSGLTFSATRWIFAIQILTLLCLVVSLVTGVSVVVNRLTDFRKTTQLIRNRKEKFEIDNKIKSSDRIKSIEFDITNLKKETDKLGETTWCLLKLQIWTFTIGTIFGIIYLLTTKNAST